MSTLRIFISSVQSEFAQERAMLRDYILNHAYVQDFFDVCFFEDVPAVDQRPDEFYLDEVERSDIYIGLFGSKYGAEDRGGISPTEREFDQASSTGKHRLIFVKDVQGKPRDSKMQALIHKAEASLVRKRFKTSEELISGVDIALAKYLKESNLIRTCPFDEAPCFRAKLEDLDPERIVQFIRTARSERGFPLPENTHPEKLLNHLDLLTDKGELTNAAILLFGKDPQRFLLSSEVKCAHFYGTNVEKPIPTLQVYYGDVFKLVDQAVGFVLSKIDCMVGTRSESGRAPRIAEIPKKVITEAIVNAVVHRDYTSSGTVQVMLFSDRLEIWNPGGLPNSLTLEQLRVAHPSKPHNRLLANSMFLGDYIERVGTGTVDMIRRCIEADLPEPQFKDDGFFSVIIRRSDHDASVMVHQGGEAIANVKVVALTPDGTLRQTTTNEHGKAYFKLGYFDAPTTVFAFADGFNTFKKHDWSRKYRDMLSIELIPQSNGAPITFSEVVGELVGFEGV